MSLTILTKNTQSEKVCWVTLSIKVLNAFGSALRREFGQRSAVGRYAGRKFTVLRQVENKEEARMLRDKIKETANSIREVDGKPITLYLSIGYVLYSEFLDSADQTKCYQGFPQYKKVYSV